MSTTTRPMTHLTPGQALSAARAFAREKMPYFQAGMLSLVPQETKNIRTMAVTDESILLFNSDALRSWTPAQAGAVVIHEYLHIFLNHAARLRKLVSLGVLQATEEDFKLWNRAADCEINDNLLEAQLELPKGPNGEPPCTPASMGLPLHRTAEEYVALLKKEREQGGGKAGNQGPPEPQAGGGWDGSGGGAPVPGEPAKGGPNARSELDQHVQRKSDAEQIRQAASKSPGTVPGGLVRAADAVLEPPRVPWQQLLLTAAQNAIAYAAGSGDTTWSRPSRRQASFAGMADAPILPGTHEPTVKVAVVVDTSGSMGDEVFREIMSECQGIFRSQAGAQVTFVACDAEVHELVEIRDARQMRGLLKGGGGTDFRPAFAALEKRKPRPEVVVFATDGYGPAPEAPPRGMKVIWLIVPGGKNACPWGQVVEMKPASDPR